MNPLLSLIIPAYNCEKYITDCINSIIHQDLSPCLYEIIIINDGSTDNTLSILEQISKSHNNIQIHTQENQGRHIARNIGARIAKGKYIWFIDNDDVICKNCLKQVIDITEQLNLDVFSVAPPLPFVAEFPKDFNLDSDVTDVISGKDFLLKKASYWAPWEFIINRSFYIHHGFEFRLKYFLEDIELMFRIFYFAKRIAAFSKFSCYSYIKRPESETMQPWTVNKVMDYARYINLVQNFISEHNLKDPYKHKFELLRTQFYLNALNNWKTIKDQISLRTILAEIKYRPKTTYGSFIEKLYQNIAIYSPSIFVKLK